MHHLVTTQYQGMSVTFTDDGWFNATEVANRFGKRPNDWLALPTTKDYIAALERKYGSVPYSKTRKGGDTRKSGIAQGTWLHPKLAVRFAQWLDVDFAVWCDEQIEALIHGAHPSQDRRRLRHEAAATYKVMGAILQLTRRAKGKGCQARHFMTEAKLVNWALVGKFQGLDRDDLENDELDLLAKLEELNAVLIGTGAEYEKRKSALHDYAEQWRRDRMKKLAA